MFDMNQVELALAAGTVVTTLGFLIQSIRAASKKRRWHEAEARATKAEEVAQDRDVKYSELSSRGKQLERNNKALETRLERTRADFERARADLGKERAELKKLQELISTRPTRVQHDVSRRLDTVSLRIQENVRNKDVRNALVRELQVITEKLELHVSDNIAAFVKNRSEDHGLTADGLSIWELAKHVIALENYSNVYLDMDEDMVLEGHWVPWELLLTQLISNAVEHASKVDGQVRLEVIPQADGLVSLQVTNDGNHIPEENLDRVCQVGFTTKENKTGSGMGLYIAQQVAVGLRGRIERPENLMIKRSRFAFRKTPAVRFTVKNLPVFKSPELGQMRLENN
jgi:signal transduction histidine kinase